MKKIFALIMVLAVMLCFTGCGEQELYDEANALLEAENYEEALAKFHELGDYEDSVVKCEEAEKNIENKKLYDEAINLVNSGKYGEAFNLFNQIKDYKDVNIYLDRFKTIELTPENWKTYFDIKMIPVISKDNDGKIKFILENHCLLLKDEYESKLCVTDLTDITIDWECDVCDTVYLVNEDNSNYSVSKVVNNLGKYPMRVELTDTVMKANTEPIADNAVIADYDEYSNIVHMNVIKYYEESKKWLGISLKNVDLVKIKGSIILFE